MEQIEEQSKYLDEVEAASSCADRDEDGNQIKSNQIKGEIEKSSSKDTRQVRAFRFLIVCLFVGIVVLIVVGITYSLLVKEQEASFNAAFAQFSGSVHDALLKQQRQTFEASNAVTKFIELQSEQMNVSRPFYNMPNHDEFFRDVIDPKDLEAIGVAVLVPHEHRQEMLDYEAEHCPDCLYNSHMHRFGNIDMIIPGVADEFLAIAPEGGLELSPEKEFYGLLTYRYMPMDSCSVQMDYLSDPEYGPLFDTAILLDQPLITYVAVTGVPYAQDDHVLRMCRFASNCLSLFATTLHRLEDTVSRADLRLRVGIHSGEVTGGVLRGLRSRFQLFGDAMNTASRHETTGAPGRVHVSITSADLIKENGHADWLEKREDKVVAKGKGELETYWLKVNVVEAQTETTSRVSSVNGW